MKKWKLFLSALLLSVSSVGALAGSHAFAATVTWTGGGGDNKISTDANWSGNTAPTAGADLVFPTDIANRTVVNDLTAGTSFNSITFSGTATANSNYTISGNSITLVGGITNSMTGNFNVGHTLSLPIVLGGSQAFNSGTSYLIESGNINLSSYTLTLSGASNALSGVVSGTGAITKTGTGEAELSGDNTYSGATTVSAGSLVAYHANALGTTAGGTTVASGATLFVVKGTGDYTVAEPLTLSGNGINQYAGALEIDASHNSGGAPNPPYPTTTFSGTLTLGSDVKIGAGNRNAKITGAISGNHTITLLDGSNGTVELASSNNGSATANGTLSPAAKETAYDDDQASTPITVNANETAIVKGTYGDVYVDPQGKLKGTGTVGTVNLFGTVAPGLSPGCLTTGDFTFGPNATYEAEIGGATACTQYDQIKVTGSVTASGTLSISLYNGFKPVAGQKYVIVSNDGSDAVVGEFSNAAEGAKITVNGYTFTISYKGGDGNDIELTASGTAPKTGLALIKNNPLVSVSVLGAAGAGVLFASRQGMKPVARKRQ